MDLEDMSREELINLAKTYAVNWLAHDGCWFLVVEEEQGMDKAIQFDTKSWEQFTKIEARRIMKNFNIPSSGGLDALKIALFYRLYAAVNKQEIVEEKQDSFVFRMVECRVQTARKRKELPLFPCKPVGLVEYAGFAATIDEHIHTECLTCPPDENPSSYYCAWRFSYEEH